MRLRRFRTPWRREMKAIVAGARNVAPYLLIELLMPGGTLLALLLWLRERRRKPA
jgi:hypothetical protein